MRTIFILTIILGVARLGNSQPPDTSNQMEVVRLLDIEDQSLVFNLTYINPENIDVYQCPLNNVEVKVFKIPNFERVYLIDLEIDYRAEFFYILISENGEYPHAGAKLYRSPDLLRPELVSITESKDSNYFLINIQHWEFQLDDSKAANQLRQKRSDLTEEYYTGAKVIKSIHIKVPR